MCVLLCVCVCVLLCVCVLSLQAKTDQLTEEVAKLAEDDGPVNDGQPHANSEVRCLSGSVTGTEA